VRAPEASRMVLMDLGVAVGGMSIVGPPSSHWGRIEILASKN
jgi:hypothetical protein